MVETDECCMPWAGGSTKCRGCFQVHGKDISSPMDRCSAQQGRRQCCSQLHTGMYGSGPTDRREGTLRQAFTAVLDPSLRPSLSRPGSSEPNGVTAVRPAASRLGAQ